MKRKSFLLLSACIAAAPLARAAKPLTAAPAYSMAAIEADTGRLLISENGTRQARPASVTKLMTMLVVLDAVRAGETRLDSPVYVSAGAAGIGGSQVYLAEGESFTVDEMLYALMIKSANDVARALAEHVCGDRDAFVERMNRKAKELGMLGAEFHNEHGLPPSKGQGHNLMSARDACILGKAALEYPETLRYTSTKVRGFRNDTFELRSHNPLLGNYPGCDGLKTGYYYLAGWSITVTAERDGKRVIGAVLSSPDKKTRNRVAADLLDRAFERLRQNP